MKETEPVDNNDYPSLEELEEYSKGEFKTRDEIELPPSDEVYTVTSSLMGKMLVKGEYQDEDGKLYYCPAYLNEWIEGTIKDFATEAMNNGSYFETAVLGSGAKDRLTLDLRRKKPTKAQEAENLVAADKGEDPPHEGAKRIDQIRIDEQIEAFPAIINMYDIIVNKEDPKKNTQIAITKYLKFKEFTVNVIMHLDLVSPILFEGEFFESAVIDLKLPKNLHSERHPYCWETPQFMDHTQLILYMWGTGFPGFYLLFDYKKEKREHKVLRVLYTEIREARLFEDIRKVGERLKYHDIWGWEPEAKYERCEKCSLSPKYKGSCKAAILNNTI